MVKIDKKLESLPVVTRKIFSLFYANNKKQFYSLFVVVFLSSLVEVVSLTAIIPVLYLLSQPASIENNRILSFLYTYLHFHSFSRFIFFLLAGIVLLFILKSIFLLFASNLLNKFTYGVSHQIVKEQMTRFYKNDYLDVKDHNSAEYLRCLLEAPRGFANNLMMPAIYILNELLVLVLIVTGLLIYQPYVVLLILVAMVPVSFFLLYASNARLKKISDMKARHDRESYLETTEAIHAYADIKLLGREDFFIHKIVEKFKWVFAANVKKNLYLAVPRRIIEVLVLVCILAVYGCASLLFNFSSRELILLLITFATAAYRILPSANEIFTNIITIRTSQYIFDLLNLIETTVVPAHTKLDFKSQIEMKNISFKYLHSDNMVIRDLNLMLRKGEVVVLSGDSGAGKTTVAKILTGFVKPDAGQIFIDGQPLVHFNQIKDKVSYVAQDFYLLDNTILENIAVGDDSPDMERIASIVESVNLSAFINSLPNKLSQQVGEMGFRISGGEKQRLALARALYKNPELLILDEVTGSLDKKNEKEILEMVQTAAERQHMAVLLITHRPGSVSGYDKWYALSKGKLQEQEAG